MTTHWDFGAELARRYPAAIVDTDPIFIRDGDLYTSAGIDLALALVEEDQGRKLALSIARYLVLYLKRSGGQAQFSTAPAIQKVQLWCQENLEGDLHIAALCRIGGMSQRDFVRKIRQETGQPPGEYVASVRLEAACQCLAETRLSLKLVADRCGFGTAVAMQRAFMRRIGATPRQYRENWNHK